MNRYGWYYLDKSERRALFCLLLVIFLIFCVRYWLLSKREQNDSGAGTVSVEWQSFERQMRSDSVKQSHQKEGVRQATLFPFDPNRADSATFVRLGLRPWQARNALRYREKGGRWRSADDFARLYGLSRKDFLLLRPYIRISGEKEEKVRIPRTERKDTFLTKYPEKYAEGTVIDLNEADTTTLQHIPGIGSYYSGKICRYRERMGGFVSVSQIAEVEGLPQGVERWFSVKSDAEIRKINVNKATFKELVRHPYLSYEQVKVITEYIRKHGGIQDWSDLRLSRQFSDADFQRLRPYFIFH